MSILGWWIVLGGVAGWIGSLLINKTGEGLFRDIVVGIVGAVVGGMALRRLRVRRGGRHPIKASRSTCGGERNACSSYHR
jgi:uncharacterized membrane protein YeaQ/YmgE (transglycosylase-associated protein family)